MADLPPLLSPVLPERQQLPALSLRFADLILRLGQTSPLPDPSHALKHPLWLAAFAVLQASSQQQSCLDLQALSGQSLAKAFELEISEAWSFPSWSDWLPALEQAQSSGVISDGRQRSPLVFNAPRLYLYRYWHYEQQLARALAERSQIQHPAPEQLPQQLQQLFEASATGVDWQQIAAASALLNTLTLISGGPGTGKTTTVARLLVLLLTAHPEHRVVLTAPTGKAAARMKQALDKSRQDLLQRGIAAELLANFPQEALTLHRLLGYQPGRIDFRHHANHPLPWDVIILDEASMVDLALMAKLLDAIAPSTRLIMLGDKDQLASVEAGAVLADLCGQSQPEAFSSERRKHLLQLTQTEPSRLLIDENPFSNVLIHLTHSHRFDAHSGIGRLAVAIREGQQAAARAILADSTQHAVRQRPHPPHLASLQQELLTAFGPYLQANTPADALAALECFMLLAALRRGPFGVEALNRQMEQIWCQHAGISVRQAFYHRRPILITANDYTHQLYNGDIGVVWNPTGNKARIFFQRTDGSIKDFAPAQLGKHESAWALTVHKSQGSEFEQVWLLLPSEPHPLLTREMIYTGLTRARQSVTFFGPETVLAEAIKTRVQRASGLAEALASQFR